MSHAARAAGSTEEKLRTYVVGRSDSADVVLADDSVAPRHAEVVETDDGRFYITDCVTATGTWRRVSSGEEGGADARPLWEQVRQAFVRRDEPLRLGDHHCTLNDLLGAVPKDRALPNAQPAWASGPPAEQPQRLRGRVERDATTGEIIRKRP
jgi:hypothetical protein